MGGIVVNMNRKEGKTCGQQIECKKAVSIDMIKIDIYINVAYNWNEIGVVFPGKTPSSLNQCCAHHFSGNMSK
jgi:hypothetical protein